MIVAIAMASSVGTTIARIQITESIVAQTVREGSPVRFEPKFEADGPVTFQWLHDGNPIRNATNASFTVLSATVASIGKYSVVLRDFSSVITNSAILDIAVDYPEIRIEEVVTLPAAPDPPTVLGTIALPSGNLAQTETSVYAINRGMVGYQRFRSITPPADLLWQSNWDSVSGDVYQTEVYASLDFAPTGNIRIGSRARNRPTLLGTNLSSRNGWVQAEVTERGQLVYMTVIDGFIGGDFVSNFDGTVTVNSRTNEIISVARDGTTLAQTNVPPQLKLKGRAFHAIGGNIPEFGFISKLPGAVVFGKLSASLAPVWITEVDLRGRWVSSWYPFSSSQWGSVESPTDDGIISPLWDTNGVIISKILPGKIAWEIPVLFSSVGSLSRIETTSFGTIICVGQSEGFVLIGGRKVGPFGDKFAFCFTADQAGFVRNVTVLPYFWVGKQPARRGASRYFGFSYDEALKRYTRVSLRIPEPDLLEMSSPLRILTIGAGQQVSLTASPDIAGVCNYQWLRNGVVISSETSRSLDICNFTVGDIGEYSVVIRNAYAKVTNRIAVLKYTGPVQLNAEKTGDLIRLTWPDATGYRLQRSSTIPPDFVDVVSEQSTNSSLNTIATMISPSSSAAIYRLSKP